MEGILNRGDASDFVDKKLITCWWCSKGEVKDYQYGVCYNCHQNLSNKIAPGLLGRKTEQIKDVWNKLKTIVTKMNVPPSDALLKAYMQSENKETCTTDIDLTLKILKKGAAVQKDGREPRFGKPGNTQKSFNKPPTAGGAKKGGPAKPPVFEQKQRPKEKNYLAGVGLKAMNRCQSQSRPHPIFEDYESDLAKIQKQSYSQIQHNNASNPALQNPEPYDKKMPNQNKKLPPAGNHRQNSVGPSQTTGPLQRPVIEYGKPQYTTEVNDKEPETKYSKFY